MLHFLGSGLCVLHAKLLQACQTFCDSMDCSPPGSSVHGILQARIQDWVALSSFRESSWPRDQSPVSYVSHIRRQVLYHQCHQRLGLSVSFKLQTTFLYLFVFDWRIIALQYCVGFCHTSAWISNRYTCVPSLHLQPHPSPLGCHRAWIWAPYTDNFWNYQGKCKCFYPGRLPSTWILAWKIWCALWVSGNLQYFVISLGRKIGLIKHKERNKEGKYVFKFFPRKFKSGGDESSFIFGQ